MITDRSYQIADVALAAGALQKRDELAGLVDVLSRKFARERFYGDPVVLEIGCDAGGTLAAWRALTPVVFGVDLPGQKFGTGRPRDDHGAIVIGMDSHSPEARGAVSWALRSENGSGAIRPVDFLMIDGDHTYDGVLADFVNYSPLVRKGGVIAFHDICEHPGQPEVGVPRFWRELGIFGGKRELIAEPRTWGGIGYFRKQ